MIVLFIHVCSCDMGREPNDGMMRIIDETEDKLYDMTSLDEMEQCLFDMLHDMTTALDGDYNGHRYAEGEEDYNVVMKRLDRFNIVYIRALSRFNPELDTEKGDTEKVVHVIALLRKMEESTLTKPEGFAPKSDRDMVFEDHRSASSDT